MADDLGLSNYAKTYLSRVRQADSVIRNLCSARCSLRINLYGMPHGHGDAEQTRRILARIRELEREIDTYVDALIGLKADALLRIREMDSLSEQDVLIARYIQLMSWHKIAAQMHYSEQHIYRLHGTALLSFGQIIRRETDTSK